MAEADGRQARQDELGRDVQQAAEAKIRLADPAAAAAVAKALEEFNEEFNRAVEEAFPGAKTEGCADG